MFKNHFMYIYQLKDFFPDYLTISQLREISSLAGEKLLCQTADMWTQLACKLAALTLLFKSG
jgi:hypothetical protein